MSKKVNRPLPDFERALVEQYLFLKSSAQAYDAGEEAEGKRLALTIRVLLHDSRNSDSLLKSLGKTRLWFYNTAPEIDRNNLIACQSPLIIYEINPKGARSIPLCLAPGASTYTNRRQTFNMWWSEQIVFLDAARHEWTRREITLTVGDKDGGAHVDEVLPKPYVDLSTNETLGVYPFIGKFENNPILAAVRQIGFEVIKTLETEFPFLICK